MPPLSRRRALRGSMAALAGLALLDPARPLAAEGAPKRETDFLSLGDFTVNLPGGTRRPHYLVVSVTIETRADQAQAFREIAPRLRQAVLQRLLQMAQQQMLQPGRTDTSMLRESLFDGLAQVREDGLKDVVITRLLHS